ncbi:membrane protein [Streptomyces sp. NRRL WC-3549]|uniref:membrane protein n=1 Tax=Streptomyces sp. NRRL WC-3549 TaxID=1463925 RepID=UPI0004C6F867|nr:membrane protein [Streptomyces sp. NRRL WC-3549]
MDGFDFSPGAQIPLQGSGGQAVATNALASAAYRDSDVTEILKANSEWHKSEVKRGSSKLFKSEYFKPNLGEAFSRAVQERMLGGGRGALIQSFGLDPQTVVEHCLSATRLRRARDSKLTLVTAVFGVLFLPGFLLWVLTFRLRDSFNKSKDVAFRSLGVVLLLIVGGLSVLFLIAMPLTGFLALYLRAAVVAPVVGWLLAKRIAESSAKDMRARWEGLLSGAGVIAKIPEAAPKNPNETAREALRQGLEKLSAEQQSNSVFYAGPKGILGMGTRWGSWHLAEELHPADPTKEIHQFRSWDVVRAIHDQLKLLERGPLNTGGFTPPSVKHWIVSPVGEDAGSVSRPEGEDVATFQVKPHEIQRICNHQQFGSGDRHYLGVQFTLWEGQLVLTMLITVTVLHETLRIEVTGHALGPVHPLFLTKPAAETKTVKKAVRFWETRSIALPLVKAHEVVRLALRAPLTWYPPLLEYLGGKLVLPEPFGLRHAWAAKPWGHRFMADDAMRTATPVLRVVHSAAVQVLKEHGVDTERFTSRSMALSGAVQEAAPKKADVYDA